MKILHAVITLSLTVPWPQAALARSDKPLKMAPATPWTLDHAESSCALLRSFTAGSDQMLMELRAFGTSPDLEVTLTSSNIPLVNKDLRTRFEPDSGFTRHPDAVRLTGKNRRTLRFTDSLAPALLKAPSEPKPEWPKEDRPARERAITGLVIAGGAPRQIALETGPMDEQMAALRTCVDGLLTRAGLDPVVQRSLSREAKPTSLKEWAREIMKRRPTSEDAKGSKAPALRDWNGRIRTLIRVGTDGNPVSCSAVDVLGAKELGDYACGTAMKYARFEPALDAAGEPVESFFITTVAYTSQDGPS